MASVQQRQPAAAQKRYYYKQRTHVIYSIPTVYCIEFCTQVCPYHLYAYLPCLENCCGRRGGDVCPVCMSSAPLIIPDRRSLFMCASVVLIEEREKKQEGNDGPACGGVVQYSSGGQGVSTIRTQSNWLACGAFFRQQAPFSGTRLRDNFEILRDVPPQTYEVLVSNLRLHQPNKD